MPETYQPPTISPAGPPHDHTHVYVIPAPPHVIPAKAGIHPRLQNPAECDRMRRNATETRARPPACARARGLQPPSAANRATMKSCYYEDGTAIPDHPDLCAGRGKPWVTDACK